MSQLSIAYPRPLRLPTDLKQVVLCRSSAVFSYSYSAVHRIAYVWFQPNFYFRYHDVPPSVGLKPMTMKEGIGAFINQHIKKFGHDGPWFEQGGQGAAEVSGTPGAGTEVDTPVTGVEVCNLPGDSPVNAD